MKPKKFKVVLIPDATRVVIDAGKGEISTGDTVEIYKDEIPIKHPYTGEIIGFYTIPKARLTVTDVHDSYSIVRDEVRKQIKELSSPMLSNFYTRYQRIAVDESDNLNLSPENNPIKIGDYAKIISKKVD